MRIEPSDVLLRLEPGAHLVNRKTGKVRDVPAVELHWKDGRKWRRKTFMRGESDGTLGQVLRDIADWLDACPDLETALAELGAS